MEDKIFSSRTILAIKLAKQAGNKILEISKNGDLKTREKGLKDVLTIADTTSEDIIVDGIKKNFSNDTIIAEENHSYIDKISEYMWAVDPLDGTSNYSRGIPTYCVSIGYMKNGIPEGGAIYIPTTDELYVCEKGKGAYCNGKKLQVSNTSSLEKSLCTIGFNNRYPEMVDMFCEIHKNAMKEMANVEKLFSTVISLCYVASGKIEAHMELYCFLWDICAAALLIEEAGGKVSGIDGEKIDFLKIDKQIIIASNKNIYDSYLNLIKKSRG